MRVNIYIWMVLTVLLMAACRGDDGNREATTDDCFLTIYVYSPAAPIVTRADAGYMEASEEESAIHSLQLWVFGHDSGALVGYLEEEDVTLGEGATYRVAVSPAFADAPVHVDVYAVANIAQANSGHTFNRLTPRSELDEATLKGDCFGTQQDLLTHEVPAEGLPMSGVLRDQPIYGTFPALRIGTESQMATLRLVRAVSKVRFFIGRGHDDSDPAKQLDKIVDITLDGHLIPAQSYLMLEQPFDLSLTPGDPLGGSRLHIVPDDYDNDKVSFGAPATADIPIIDDPLKWSFNAAEVLPWGTTYLRESDKRLTGAVAFTNKAEPDIVRTATFEMSRAGDFGRNHVWTVLVLFAGGNIRFFSVTDMGITEWTDGGEDSHGAYNW